MNFLEDLKMSLFNFNFVMKYMIHLNFLKDNIFKCFFKEQNGLFLNKFFSHHIMTESLSLEEEKIIKDTRNLFSLQKEPNYTGIKHIKKVFILEKRTKATNDRILKDIKNLFEYEEQEENFINQ